MKKLTISLLLVTALCVTGCNYAARNFGGTVTVDLPAGEKLVSATWKESDLWYLTRPMKAGEEPETLHLRESSSLGMANGTVVFKEKK